MKIVRTDYAAYIEDEHGLHPLTAGPVSSIENIWINGAQYEIGADGETLVPVAPFKPTNFAVN